MTLYGRGEAVAVIRSASTATRGGTAYLGKDALGSVRSATNDYGTIEDRYEYDAFGKPYTGDLSSGMNLGYTGKPYDAATGLYNYGYRDYQPAVARFTTVDPVRDGRNWFAYVNNDPVNWVDPWGLSPSTYTYIFWGQSANFYWPTASGSITSVPGPVTPVYDKDGRQSNPEHLGIDIAGQTGQDITSIGCGVVTSITKNHSSLGNTVTIEHPGGKQSVYAHLDSISPEIKNGQFVDSETVIGEMGKTGLTSGVHLHLEIRDVFTGNQINPFSVLPERPSAVSVSSKYIVQDPRTGVLSNKLEKRKNK